MEDNSGMVLVKRRIDQDGSGKIDKLLAKKKKELMEKQSKPCEERFPSIYHVISKRDLMTEEGYGDYLLQMEDFKAEGIIDQYFFISSQTAMGIKELQDEIFI
jgi:hypothetical protein